MDLLAPIRSIRRKVVGKMKQKKVNEEHDKFLSHWKRVFEADKSEKRNWDTRIDEWEALYCGNYEFDNLRRDDSKKVRTIVNFPRMIIESQIDLNVPDPDFKPVAADDEEAVKSIQSEVMYVVRSAQPSLEEINLSNERRVRKFGGTFFKVHWNNQIKRAGYVGDVEISNPHPKDIIPNASATSTFNMEHYHHVTNHTANYIIRKWRHVDEDELEQKALLNKEYDEMSDTQNITVESPQESEGGLKRYSIIETTYKDMDGDIGKFWWSGDLYIEHIPKFYYRRHPETGELMETETVDDMEIPYYIPKSWDLIYQLFIPRDKCFWGVSMMEDMKDIQESLKKVIYIEEEKILRGTTKVLTDSEETQRKLTDPLSEIIYVPGLGPQSVKEIQMGQDGARGIQWIEMMKDFMQLITGATNPALGQEATNVTSGKQAMAYISQAQQKVDIATAYKIAAYKQLYRVVADFILAFADFDRPYRLEGKNGQPEYGIFNRTKLLRDRNGNIIYPDYDIDIGAEAGFMKAKPQIVEMITFLANSGRFEPTPANLYLLKILDKLGVPHLQEVIGNMETTVQQRATNPGGVMPNAGQIQGPVGQDPLAGGPGQGPQGYGGPMVG